MLMVSYRCGLVPTSVRPNAILDNESDHTWQKEDIRSCSECIHITVILHKFNRLGQNKVVAISCYIDKESQSRELSDYVLIPILLSLYVSI